MSSSLDDTIAKECHRQTQTQPKLVSFSAGPMELVMITSAQTDCLKFTVVTRALSPCPGYQVCDQLITR